MNEVGRRPRWRAGCADKTIDSHLFECLHACSDNIQIDLASLAAWKSSMRPSDFGLPERHGRGPSQARGGASAAALTCEFNPEENPQCLAILCAEVYDVDAVSPQSL